MTGGLSQAPMSGIRCKRGGEGGGARFSFGARLLGGGGAPNLIGTGERQLGARELPWSGPRQDILPLRSETPQTHPSRRGAYVRPADGAAPRVRHLSCSTLLHSRAEHRSPAPASGARQAPMLR